MKQSIENNFEYDERIEIEVNGMLVLGIINKLSKYYIEVEIVYPYANWTNFLSTNGPGRMNPNNFHKRYKEVSEELLKESYQKLKIIDDSIDRICKVYNNLQKELVAISVLNDVELKETIKSKLEGWFFGNFLFTSSVTGLIGSFSEERKIIEILQAYQRDGTKIYEVSI